MNVADNLRLSAFYFPDNLALIEDNRSITFSDFNREADKVASALVGLGVKPGDQIAICAPNSIEWLVFYFGILKAGAVAVTFFHLSTPKELSKILADCEPKVLLTTDDKLAYLEGFRKDKFPEVVVCNNGDLSFSELIEKGTTTFKSVNRDRHDVAAILYTGGTTGTPKGAMLTHQNLQTSIFNVAYYERSTQTNKSLCFLPLNHVFGQVHIMLATVFCGGCLVIQNGFEMEKALDAIEHYKVTNFYAVPTVYVRMMERSDLEKRIRSVRYCFSAAASMAAAVVKAWKTRTSLAIHESYGMTESATMVTYNHYYRHVVGSVGTPVNLVEVQIRDLEGNILSAEEKGEICIRGPNITKGYLNNPEETANAFWGEWFRSGDIGILDKDEYLYIVDRLKDMIITGGENVYAREVEEVLYTLPEVLECAVVGLPDPEYGERVTAFIVPHEGRQIDPIAMKSALKIHLTGFKVPKGYITVTELPKSSAGKLLKRELKEQYKTVLLT